jgi:hypothetical protein
MSDVRAELKEHLVPRLRGLGFTGSFPHFRRPDGERNQLLTFQFDKYGSGRFVIELAVAPRGEFTTYWGKVIPESKLTAHDLAERLRLGAADGGDSWLSIGKDVLRSTDEILELLRTQGQRFFEDDAQPGHG